MTRERHAAASRSDIRWRDGSFLSQASSPKKSNHKIIRRFLINIVIQPVAISGGLPPNDARASCRRVEERHTVARRKFLSQISPPQKSNHKIIRRFLIKIVVQPVAIKSGGLPQMTRKRHTAASRSDIRWRDGSFYRKPPPQKN